MEYKSFYNYDIYENGVVYSHYRKRFLNIKPDSHGYIVGVFYINGYRVKIKIHRLVALLFLGAPKYNNYIVNHKDGVKTNNHYSNLEWCSYRDNNIHARRIGLNDITASNKNRWKDVDFQKIVSEKISKHHIENKTFVGKRNPRFKYNIVDNNGIEYSRKELSKIIGLSQSRTDVLIRKCALGESNQYFDTHKIRVFVNKTLGQSTIENEA